MAAGLPLCDWCHEKIYGQAWLTKDGQHAYHPGHWMRDEAGNPLPEMPTAHHQPIQESEEELEVDDRVELENTLLRWMNSLNELHSDKLSSVGIDDAGDLRDECPTFRAWVEDFYRILWPNGDVDV